MRKMIVLAGLMLVSVIACQKDYYLDDLNDANEEIKNLKNQITESIDRLNILNENLLKENNELTQRNDDLMNQLNSLQNYTDNLYETYVDTVDLINSEKEDLNLEIDALRREVILLEEKIEDLENNQTTVQQAALTIALNGWVETGLCYSSPCSKSNVYEKNDFAFDWKENYKFISFHGKAQDGSGRQSWLNFSEAKKVSGINVFNSVSDAVKGADKIIEIYDIIKEKANEYNYQFYGKGMFPIYDWVVSTHGSFGSSTVNDFFFKLNNGTIPNKNKYYLSN